MALIRSVNKPFKIMGTGRVFVAKGRVLEGAIIESFYFRMVHIGEILIFNWIKLAYFSTRQQAGVMCLALFWWIWSRGQWTLSEVNWM